jgi:hypothetical protein
MNNLSSLFEEDSMKTPDFSDMDKLGQLINKQLQLEQDITEIEMTLSEHRAQLRRIAEEEIPNMFQQLGIQEFKLQDGSKVTVKPYYAASISAENEVAAFDWLREHNLDDVIKHNIVIAFGRGEDQKCTELKDELTKLNVNYIEKANVHPQTLKALVREQIELMSERLEQGEQFPMKLFNVFIGNKTKIVKPKGR